MRILYIHETNYMTKPIFEMHEFPEYLSCLGNDLGFLHFPEGNERKLGGSLVSSEFIPGRLQLDGGGLLLFTPTVQFGGVIGRLITAIRGFAIVGDVLDRFQPDVIVSLAVPTYGWQALVLAKIRKIPFVYRALDVSHLIRKTRLKEVIRIAERFVQRSSDRVSANNESMRRYSIMMGARASKVSVCLPPMDIDMFSSSVSGARAGSFPGKKRVVMYMGTFFHFSGLIEVVRRFGELLKNSDCDTEIWLVGSGEAEADIRQTISELCLEKKVLLKGFVPFDRLPEMLGHADVFINPMKASLVSDVALPNKLIQYLASKGRVVSTRLEGAFSVFGEEFGVNWAESPEMCIEIATRLPQVSLSTIEINNRRELLRDLFGTRNVKNFEAELRQLVANK